MVCFCGLLCPCPNNTVKNLALIQLITQLLIWLYVVRARIGRELIKVVDYVDCQVGGVYTFCASDNWQRPIASRGATIGLSH